MTPVYLRSTEGVSLYSGASVAGSGMLVVHSDLNADGTGAFTCSASGNISVVAPPVTRLLFTVADIALDASCEITATIAPVQIEQSQGSGIIEVGSPLGNLAISNAELNVITTSSYLMIGGQRTGNVTVMELDHSSVVGELFFVGQSLVHFTGSGISTSTRAMKADAGGLNGQVVVSARVSGLSVNMTARAGIDVTANISSTGGYISIDGDSEEAQSGVTSLGSGVYLTAMGGDLLLSEHQGSYLDIVTPVSVSYTHLTLPTICSV